MNVKRLLGLDTHAERYAYTVDPVAGFVSAQQASDRWVSTTCGYCSVGCGMFIGVKDGRAVSVRGNPDHPVNRGMLCPKGLSEHHTIAADGRARYPLLQAAERPVRAASAGPQALETMAARFREVQAQHGPGAVGVISTGQLVTEEFYALGKLVQLGLGTPQLRRQHDALHVDRRGRLQAIVRQRRAARRVRRPRARRRDPAHRRQHRRQPPDPVPAARSQPRHHAHRRRSARDQDRDDGRPAPADPAAIGSGAAQRPDSHRHRARPRRSRLHRPRTRPASRRCASRCASTRPSAWRRSPGSTPDRAVPDGGALRQRASRVHRLDDGREPQLEGHRDRQRDQQPRAHHRQHRASRARRRSRSPASATPWARAKPAFASCLPGYRKFESAADRAEIAALWNVPVERIPTARGLAYPDIIEAALDRRIRALWIIATNPIVSFPNLGVLQQALEELDFLVVQDGFHPDADVRAGATSCCPRRSGARRRAPTPTPSAASARSIAPSSRRERRAPTSTSFSIWRPRSACATSCFPGWSHAARRLRGVEARVRGPTLRLLGHDLRSDRGARRHPVAVSRRRDRPAGDRVGSTPTAASRPTTAGRG